MEPNKDIQTNNLEAAGDDIFVVKPEPKQPVNKKSIWITIGATIFGVIVLIAVLVGALIASAGGLAEDYQRGASEQLKKLSGPLEDLEPSLVLSNRDISGALDKIYVSKQAQPALASTLFFDELNPEYAAAKKTQADITKYYKDLDIYTTDLKQLLVFDDQVNEYIQQDGELVARVNPDDSLTIRSVGGSYRDIADKIDKQNVPTQLKALQSSLADTFSARATVYSKWAVNVEAGDKSTTAALQTEIARQKDKATALVTDKNYTKLLTPTYKELLAEQKSILTALAN